MYEPVLLQSFLRNGGTTLELMKTYGIVGVRHSSKKNLVHFTRVERVIHANNLDRHDLTWTHPEGGVILDENKNWSLTDEWPDNCDRFS